MKKVSTDTAAAIEELPRRRLWISSPPGAPRQAVSWRAGAPVEDIEHAISKAAGLTPGAPLDLRDGDAWVTLSVDLPDDLHLDVVSYMGAAISPPQRFRSGRSSAGRSSQGLASWHSEGGASPSLRSSPSTRSEPRLGSKRAALATSGLCNALVGDGSTHHTGGVGTVGLHSGYGLGDSDDELGEIPPERHMSARRETPSQIEARLTNSVSTKEVGALARQQGREQSTMALTGHMGAVLALCTVGDVLFTGSQDTTIMIWDLNNLQYIGVLTGHEGFVRCLRASLAGKVLCSGSQDATIRIWSLESFCCVKMLVGHVGDVHALLIVEHNHWLVSAGEDRTLRVWDLNSFALLHAVKNAHAGGIFSLEMIFANQCLQILSGSRDRSLKVWGADSFPRRDVRQLRPPHYDGVSCLAVAPRRERFFSGSRDRSIKAWDNDTLQSPMHELHVHGDWVQALCMSPDEDILFSASRDSTVKAWNQAMNCVEVLHGHRGPVCALASVSMDNGTMLFSGSSDKTVRVWRANYFP